MGGNTSAVMNVRKVKATSKGLEWIICLGFSSFVSKILSSQYGTAHMDRLYVILELQNIEVNYDAKRRCTDF
ncbi:MAG: hypothetical protein ACRDDY_04045 [Clostridium sp.]|uniref:hypothetical protein n=1 Tax=Clostridium sp. TaxID=1506 RepID=UPI003EE80552